MNGEHRVMLQEDATDAGDELTQQRSSSSSSRSRLNKALLLFTLGLVSAAAVAAVVLNFNPKPEGLRRDGDTSGLHHMLRQLANVRAAIHLEGEYNPKRTTSVEWKTQVGQSHSQGELRLDNNEIVIPHNGLYFVYSQVSFRVTCGVTNSDPTVTSDPLVQLSHSVERRTDEYGDEEAYLTILHSVRTACERTAGGDAEQRGGWYSAVYTGAVFNLRKGDRLRTVTKEALLPSLEEDSGKTFFGVFAL